VKIPLTDLKSQYRAIEVEIKERIAKVLDHGQYIMGPEVVELETKLARYVGSKHCVTVSSGTDALLISLMALGVKAGDEVLIASFTFVSTAEVVVLLGAKPVFVDILDSSCNLDPDLLVESITEKTKAIIPVSLYGQPAEMLKINHIAAVHGDIPVVEDGAQSFGAMYEGRKSGNLSTIGCTSFFPSKPLGCYGDGGAIFTNDDDIADICRAIRIHGQTRRYEHTRIGLCGRMDTIQCAILLAKLERFDWELERRFQLGKLYNQMFDQHGIARVQQGANSCSAYAQYTIFIVGRDDLRVRLEEKGISTAVHYPVSLGEQPAYKQFENNQGTPVASSLSKTVLSLPISAYLSDSDQRYIVKSVVDLS
jgi:UDP-2-acetamido-2-deoxy-ribo-hexuluronate aminotransferase